MLRSHHMLQAYLPANNTVHKIKHEVSKDTVGKKSSNNENCAWYLKMTSQSFNMYLGGFSSELETPKILSMQTVYCLNSIRRCDSYLMMQRFSLSNYRYQRAATQALQCSPATIQSSSINHGLHMILRTPCHISCQEG